MEMGGDVILKLILMGGLGTSGFSQGDTIFARFSYSF
jgi:hypothetical protein